MSADKKRWRELQQIVEDEGLRVEDMWISGSSHIRIRIAGPAGQYTLTTSLTPSCRYASNQFRRDVRRAKRSIAP